MILWYCYINEKNHRHHTRLIPSIPFVLTFVQLALFSLQLYGPFNTRAVLVSRPDIRLYHQNYKSTPTESHQECGHRYYPFGANVWLPGICTSAFTDDFFCSPLTIACHLLMSLVCFCQSCFAIPHTLFYAGSSLKHFHLLILITFITEWFFSPCTPTLFFSHRYL